MVSKADSKEKIAVTIRDIGRTPAITVLENETVFNMTKLMDKHKIGCVVIVNTKGKPVGIITERDVVRRVVARKKSAQIKCREIMSSPLAIILADAKVDEAAARMGQRGIRRLVIMDRGKLLGVISSLDIMRVTPSLIETVFEKCKAGIEPSLSEKAPLAGYCELCGQWSELLEISGKFVCEECFSEMVERRKESAD